MIGHRKLNTHAADEAACARQALGFAAVFPKCLLKSRLNVGQMAKSAAASKSLAFLGDD